MLKKEKVQSLHPGGRFQIAEVVDQLSKKMIKAANPVNVFDE